VTKFRILVSALILLLAAPPARADFTVVTTIKPLHSIVSAIMQDIGTPKLLIRSAGSPHGYKLKPSDARMIRSANLIFWIGPSFESRLAKAINQVRAKADVIEVSKIPDLKRYKMRGKHENHDSHNDLIDPHLWLSFTNARHIAGHVTQELSRLDRTNRSKYQINLNSFTNSITALKATLMKKLGPAHDKPFLVYHDAFQYFEKSFGLTNKGALMASPEQRPGAKHIAELRVLVREQHISCVFIEPQFSKKLVQTVIKGTAARIGELDPIGTKLAPGPKLYGEMMRNLATSFVDCLM
jgi:zinc transport system substrate-binding protein